MIGVPISSIHVRKSERWSKSLAPWHLLNHPEALAGSSLQRPISIHCHIQGLNTTVCLQVGKHSLHSPFSLQMSSCTCHRTWYSAGGSKQWLVFGSFGAHVSSLTSPMCSRWFLKSHHQPLAVTSREREKDQAMCMQAESVRTNESTFGLLVFCVRPAKSCTWQWLDLGLLQEVLYISWPQRDLDTTYS